MKAKILLVAAFYILIIAIPFLSMKNLGGAASSGSSSAASSSAASSSTPSSSASQPSSQRVFKILNESSGEVFTVSEKDYVYGSVASEMPADYPEEALKAQAVASYTYAVMLRQRELATPSAELKGAYFTADPSKYKVYISQDIAKQRFGGKFDEYWGKITACVDAVFGTVATSGGAPITAAYFSVSSGKTEYSKNVWGGDVPYLVPVVSSWDASAPGYSSTASFSADQVRELLGSSLGIANFPDDKNAWFTDIARSDSGNVLNLKICGSDSSGVAVRKIFSLRSANFTVEYKNSNFIFSVLGYGHDVGMSQYGARCMALEGRNWQEILKHYYTGIDLVSVDTLNLAS